MIKCKSDQVLTERYDYTMAAGENILLPIKARRDEVILVHNVSVYNPSQSDYTNIYKVMRRRNRLCRLDHNATLGSKKVIRWGIDIYLIDGDEGGVALTPNAAGDKVEITFQCLRFRDDEYFKAT